METKTTASGISKKVLILPGSFSLISSYEGYQGIDIWLKNTKGSDLNNADWVIAHSAGVNYLFSKPIPGKQKIILINPLVKKRNIFSIFFRDIYFFIDEGISKCKIIPISNWLFAFIKIIKLLITVNVLEELKKIPKENIFIIRGLKDNYFCDKENAELIRKEGFTLFEVEAKHNWNQSISNKVQEIIGKY